MLAVVFLSVGLACGGTRITDGPLQVVPADADSVVVLDVEQILGGGVPDEVTVELIESRHGTLLQNYDIDTVVGATFDEGEFVIFDLNSERYLERLVRYLGGQYYADEVVTTFLEDREYLILGGDDSDIKHFLRTLDSGSGFLLEDDNPLARILKGISDGWFVRADRNCRIPIEDVKDSLGLPLALAEAYPPSSSHEEAFGITKAEWDLFAAVKSCLALGEAYATSPDEGTLGITKIDFYLFTNERRAELAKDVVEDLYVQNDKKAAYGLTLTLDGDFVIVTYTIDKFYHWYIESPWLNPWN